ncbi:hypothetical protein [Ileibacterium valens]|uniref:hypothetical protein n=1 Tax=Ileibacterium valens TaxID=1862668 RepID=UPI0023571962|nr:hypothetical protein [Ileibacterium valens]
MDKNLDAKLREIVDLAKKYEVINSSIKEKQNMLKQLDDVAKRIQGMPNVVVYANQAAEELKTEIASEEEMLEKIRTEMSN